MVTAWDISCGWCMKYGQQNFKVHCTCPQAKCFHRYNIDFEICQMQPGYYLSKPSIMLGNLLNCIRGLCFNPSVWMWVYVCVQTCWDSSWPVTWECPWCECPWCPTWYSCSTMLKLLLFCRITLGRGEVGVSRIRDSSPRACRNKESHSVPQYSYVIRLWLFKFFSKI